MKVKKVIAMGAAAILALTSAGSFTSVHAAAKEKTALAKSASEKDEITFPLKKKEKFSMFCTMSQQFDLKDNITMQKLQKDANVEFDIQSVMFTGAEEKRNLLISSGDYPDVFYKSGITATELEKYGKQGVFIPLEKLIKKYAPNLKKDLDKYDGWQYVTAGDGHIYSLPQINQYLSLNSLWMNQKWLKNLGLKEPTNLDELYKVLKAFKDEDANGNGDPNDEIPYTSSGEGGLERLLEYFGITYDIGNRLSIIDNKLTYVPTSDVYKKFIAFLTKLYNEGIMDKKSLTQGSEQQRAVGQSKDIYGAFHDTAAYLTVGRDRDADFNIVTPFKDCKFGIPSNMGGVGAIAITDKCKDPETIVAWADRLYSEDGGRMAYMGIEGKTWKFNDDGTWSWILPEGMDIFSLRSKSTIQGSAANPSLQPAIWGEKMSKTDDPAEYHVISERDRVSKDGKVPMPALHYNQDDAMTVATLKPDIDSYTAQYVSQVIIGKQDLDKSWDDYVKTVNDMGAKQLLGIYQKAYKAAKEKS